uniref:DUF5641 domain-containing protein n=1 Tax=Loa loa TaxID=7209 RepID=A0A1I7VFM4_LOALO
MLWYSGSSASSGTVPRLQELAPLLAYVELFIRAHGHSGCTILAYILHCARYQICIKGIIDLLLFLAISTIVLRLAIYFINKGKLAKLIVEQYCEKPFHANVYYAWSTMRQRYWTRYGQPHVKKILRFVEIAQCRWLRHLNDQTYLLIPVLKLWRRDLLIKENHANTKRWMALFTCPAAPAMHPEIVKTMPAEQCVHAFRRFISKLNKLKHIITNNAKDLIAGYKVLVELSTVESGTMEWEITAPVAPSRAIGTKLLNNGELITLVTELEVIISERPLVDLEERLDYLWRIWQEYTEELRKRAQRKQRERRSRIRREPEIDQLEYLENEKSRQVRKEQRWDTSISGSVGHLYRLEVSDQGPGPDKSLASWIVLVESRGEAMNR